MDLNEIEQILRNHRLPDGTLILPPRALLSEPIEEAFLKYLLDKDLVIRESQISVYAGANVTVTGLGASFPFENSYVTAVFTAPNAVAAMSIQGNGFSEQTPGWGFEKAFPVLSSTFYKDLKFSAAVLTVRSSNASVSEPKGLSFTGTQKFTGALGTLIKLLNGSSDVNLKGPIELKGEKTVTKVVPEMVLEAPPISSPIKMELIYRLVDDSTVVDPRPVATNGQTTVPVPAMELASRLTVDTETGKQSVEIAAHFTPKFNLLTFQADMGRVLAVSLAALNALAQNANLGSVLPSQLPLVNNFELRQWSMSVIPQVPQITSISIAAGIARPWQVIPNLLTLEDIHFEFTINYVNNKYEPNAALTARIKVLDGDAQFTIVVDAQYPSYVITGFLEEESEIDLIALVKWFFKNQSNAQRIADSIPCQSLKVAVMTLLIDPRNSTYTFETVITSECSINLGVTFTITQVAFNFSYVAGEVTGSFQAAFWLVPPQTTPIERWLIDEPPAGSVALEVSAAYNGAEDGWSFRGGLAEGGKIDLETIIRLYLPSDYWAFIPAIVINKLEAGFETGKTKSYDFSIGGEWTIGLLNTTIGALVTVRSVLDEKNVRKYTGEAQGFLRFGGDGGEGGLEFKVTANFADTKQEYTFEFLGVTAKLEVTPTEKTLTFTTGNKSLGQMIEMLINALLPGEDIQLEAPWNVLNSLKLNSFKFVVKFTPEGNAKTAGLTYEPNMNLGFAELNKIALDYEVETKRVMFRILEGRFLNEKIGGVGGGKPVEWDVAKPETTKQVPGKGSEVFRLDFLGMGQHMAVAKNGALQPVPASIIKATDQLNAAFMKKDDLTLIFNEATDWLIATRFTVLQVIDVGIVFYDPELYGLYISVKKGENAKEKLKVFEGLVFEILYKKISDTIGMWQIDLTLPKSVRNLQFGAVSVTLPSLKLQVYTNGDFMVDLGFPANDDFSRSFSLQAFPFVGSGGLYFGVLSSATSNRVPQTTKGNFSPVIAFGIGLRIGLGKDLDYGVLKAGMSITIQGVLEGILAWYNAFPASSSNGKLLTAGSRAMDARRALAPSRQLAAAAANDGNFYYMIQARVALVGKIYGSVDLGIISADLDVEIRASIRMTFEAYRAIDVFLEVKISLSLRVRINLGLFKITIRLSFKMTMDFAFTIGSTDPNPPWGPTAVLRKSAFVRRLDAADDEQCPEIPVLKWQPVLNPNKVTVAVRFVPQFTAATNGPLGVGSPRESYVVAMTYVPSKAATPDVPAAFDEIARGTLLWTLNAFLNRDKDHTTLQDILTQIVTIDDLNKIYCNLTQKDTLEPFLLDEVLSFLENFYTFKVTLPPAASTVVVEEDEEVSIFPIMPKMLMTTNTGVDVDFYTQTPASDEYLSRVKEYFQQMAVRYKTPAEEGTPPTQKTSPENSHLSLASFIFLDFFSMLARSTIQDAINVLQTKQEPLEANESLAQFVERRSNLGIGVQELAMANAARPLRAGVQLKVPGVVYTVKRGDTLRSIAAKLNHDIIELRAANPSLNGQPLEPASRVTLPMVNFTTSASEPESLLDISREYGVSINDLAQANKDVEELFPTGEPLLAPFAKQDYVAKLVDELQRNGSFNNLSGLAARVLLQGLRPPSPPATENGPLGDPAPLYELTGQQFDGSNIVDGSTVTLNVSDDISEWFELDGGDTLTYQFTTTSAQALSDLKTAPFDPPVTFQQPKLLRIEPRRFTLPTARLWQTPLPVCIGDIGGAQPSDVVEPHLWQFPSELMQIITGPQPLQPQVGLWTQRQESPGQTFDPEPVKVCAWSTVIDIRVRQTPSGDGGFLPHTYEMIGIDAGGTQLLENLLVWYADAKAPVIHNIHILYPPNPAVEGQDTPPTGLRSDPDPTFFLLQNNLSTVSQPPQLTEATKQRLAAFAPQRDPLGQTDIEFLKLLWESSIVNSGGYVLSYESEAKQGLPNYLFSQDGTATLTLLITYTITDNVLQNFLNNVVIRQVIDTEQEVLYAQPLPQTVSNFKLSQTESLADVAARYRVTVSQLATQYDNAHAKLAAGRHLRIPPVTYRVREGESLETIAARANVTLQLVNELNASANDSSAVRFLRLPETVWRVEAGDSLASLAERFSTTVVTLAHANKNVAGLIEGTLKFDDRLEQMIPTIPSGNVAFHYTRPHRVPVSGSIGPKEQLDELYNLLSYRILPGGGFTKSNSALPISPETPDNPVKPDIVDWMYGSIVPVFPFASPTANLSNTTPDPADDPYNGVGNTVTVNFNWQDLFGNWIDSSVQSQTWPNNGFFVGYIDNLIALDQWPSVTSDYIVARNEQIAGAELTTTLRFNADIYKGTDADANKSMALTDLGKFQTIYYQLTQTDVNVTLTSTMQPVFAAAQAGSPKEVMVQFVLSIINFLTPISEGLPAPASPLDKSMSQPVADGNMLNIFPLVVRAEISRNPDLVNDEFKDVPSVTSVSSRVPANAGNEAQAALTADPEPVPPLSLQEFARRLEAAFPSLKVLVSAPHKALGQVAEEIWIARMDSTPTGISFKIDGKKPSFYAATPLARNLLSRDEVLVYPYQTGKYIAKEPPLSTSQNSVDLDQMGRDFLAAMEEVLGPQFSSATWKLQYDTAFPPVPVEPPDPQKTPYEAIMAAKETLANAISAHVANVFVKPNPVNGLADAQEVLRQQLLVNLTAAFTVDVIVQYPVTITSSEYAAEDPFAPQLFGKPVTESPDDPNEVEKKDAYSFSTAKFSLAKRTSGTNLTFTFDTNREQQGKEGKQIDDLFTIELFHQINALEHEIHPVPGIDNYLASSWLTFVLPDNFDTLGAKLLVPLGEQKIPVPLRAYPTPPSLSEQTFIPYAKQFSGSGGLQVVQDDLMQARLWKYRCQYEYVGAAHDKILANIKLNVPPSEAFKAKFSDADNPDLFAALIQFTSAYPDIAKDLDKYLATGLNDDNARTAISSFAWLAQRTANAWQTWQNASSLYSAAPLDSPEYHYTIEQHSEQIGTVIALVVSVTATDAITLPQLPEIQIAGYETKLRTQTAKSASYYFEQKGEPLPYDTGRNISARHLVFSNFDILSVENAWAGAAVKRNEDLLRDETTNPEFVFQSPVVRFVNVLTPLLDPDVEINIAGYTPVTPASVAAFLSNFLIAFFQGAQTGLNQDRTIRLGASYSYGLQDSGKVGATSAEELDLDIMIPILLTTPTDVSILNLSPTSPFISAVASTINTWFRDNKPSGEKESGKLWFDLSVYSSLSESQLPVLRMRRLYLQTPLVLWPQ